MKMQTLSIPFILLLSSCLQATVAEKIFEYIPPAEDIVSHPFTSSQGDLVIVNLIGGTFKSPLAGSDFTLTRNKIPLSLPEPFRNDDQYALFSVTPPLQDGGGYMLTVKRGASVTGAGMVVAQAVQSNQWTPSMNTAFDGTAIHALAYGNGKLVAVGNSGKIAYSVDGGLYWTALAPGDGAFRSGFSGAINAVAYGDSQFYAVGDEARMGWSASGASWQPHTRWENGRELFGENYFEGKNILSIVYGKGGFVAGSAGGTIIYRRDGDNWKKSADIFPAFDVSALAWGDTGGDGLFIAGGTGGALCWSDNGGASWTETSSGFLGNQIHCAAFGNGMFIIGGDGGKLSCSLDGKTWEPVLNSPFTTGVLAIAYGSGFFVAVGHNGALARSPNGETWEQLDGHGFTAGDFIGGAAYGGGKFVIAGSGYLEPVQSTIVFWYQKPPEGN
jgi:hypothetical protein